MSGARWFLDTNVLVYLFDRDEPVKQKIARDLLERGGTDLTLCLSTQVLQEFYVVVTRKLREPVAPEAALETVSDLTHLHVVLVDVPMIQTAIRLSRRHAISFWDALIVEAAAAADCERLLSEDLQAGRQVRGVTVENPFSAET